MTRKISRAAKFAFVVIAATSLVAMTASGQSRRLAKKAKGNSRQSVEAIVREYLLKNPSIIREALAILDQREEKRKADLAAANIKNFAAELYSDANSPFAGSSQPAVTVVVFYDYFCGYCRKTLPALDELMAKDPSVKVVYKEFPILGESSMTAAMSALAAEKQGKFVEFHRELLKSDSADGETIKSIAAKLGMDFTKLQKDAADPKIAAAIHRNVTLADALNISGTPAYLIGDQLVPGAIDAGTLANMVASQKLKSTTAAKPAARSSR